MSFGEIIAGYSEKKKTKRKYNLWGKFGTVNNEHSSTQIKKKETVNREHFSTKMRKQEVKLNFGAAKCHHIRILIFWEHKCSSVSYTMDELFSLKRGTGRKKKSFTFISSRYAGRTMLRCAHELHSKRTKCSTDSEI
jgi:hypothetical protein